MATLISPHRTIVGTSLGTLYVRLTIDPQRLLTGMAGAKASVADGTAVMASQLRHLALAAATAFAGVALASANEFRKFNQAMTESSAVMGKVSDEMRAKMESLALELATHSNKSATDLAKTFYELAQAGFNAEESMRVLPTVAQFSTAAVIDTKDATKLLSESLNAMGMRTEDATKNMENMSRIADVLARASFLTTGTIKDMGDALTNKAAGAMRIFGMSLEEGVAVLSTFVQRGYSGTLAGQALYIVLRDLQRAALEQSQAWSDLGVAVYTSSGKMRPMADIVEGLTTALAGASDEQKRMVFSLLGMTDRSLAATLALMGSADQIRDFQRQLEAAGGTTREVSETILTSFQNQLVMSLHHLQNLAIELGKELAPSLMEFVRELTNAVDALAKMEKEGHQLLAVFQALFYAIKALGAGIAVVWALFQSAGSAIGRQWAIIIETLRIEIETVSRMAGMIASGSIAGAIKVLKDGASQLSSVGKDLAEGGVEEQKKIWSGLVDTVMKLFPEAETGVKSLTETTKAWGDQTVSAGVAGASAMQQVQSAAKGVENQVNQSSVAVERMINSAKAMELMRILGVPEGVAVKPVTAQELMGKMTLGEAGRMQSEQATDLLKRSGLGRGGGIVGPEGMMDTGMEQSMGISREIQAQQAKLDILKELGNSELQLTEGVQKKRLELVEAYTERLKKLYQAEASVLLLSGASAFDKMADAMAGAAGKQSGIYQAMFMASKAFAIADSIIKIQQGIAGAAAMPFPANLAAIASVIAATANIISSITAVRLNLSGRAAGGPVSPGSAFLVGEKGPEMFVPSSAGSIVPNEALSSRGVRVVINNYTDARAEVTERQEGNDRVVEVMIRRVKNELSSEIRDGRGRVNRALETTFQLKRGVT